MVIRTELNVLFTDDDTMWVCGVCGKNLHNKKLLVEHRKLHEREQPPVPQGQGQFSDRRLVKQNIVIT